MSPSSPPSAVKARVHPSVESRVSALLLSRRKLRRLSRPRGRSRAEPSAGRGGERRPAAGSREVGLSPRQGPDRQTSRRGRGMEAPAPLSSSRLQSTGLTAHCPSNGIKNVPYTPDQDRESLPAPPPTSNYKCEAKQTLLIHIAHLTFA